MLVNKEIVAKNTKQASERKRINFQFHTTIAAKLQQQGAHWQYVLNGGNCIVMSDRDDVVVLHCIFSIFQATDFKNFNTVEILYVKGGSIQIKSSFHYLSFANTTRFH